MEPVILAGQHKHFELQFLFFLNENDSKSIKED